MSDEIAKFQKRSDVAGEIANFRSRMSVMQTPDQFLKDYRVLNFTLTAYGMESQSQYPARIRQVVMSDPNDKYSVANRMIDQRYRNIAKDLAFFSKETAQLRDNNFQDYIVENYVRNEYEKSLGNLNPNLTDAIYFRRTIATVTNIDQFFGDPSMFEVVKEALGIPNAEVAKSSTEQLSARIGRGFDVTRVKDQAYVDRFVTRYLAMKDLAAQQGQSNVLMGILA